MCPQAGAQSGMSFEEFRPKLAPYYADELIADVELAMPQGATYRIWGWDVGDYTGDGFNDLAVSVYIVGSRKKECVVTLLADLDGFMTNISSQRVSFVDLPLEVGVVIKDNTCYIVQKKQDEHWQMKGYRYTSGSVVLVDEFVSNKVNRFFHQGYRNYQTLETRDTYIDRKQATVFETEYRTIPAYRRGRQVFAGIVSDVHINEVKSVVDGAYWWKGPEDASFSTKLVYDEDNLFVQIKVQDSTVVTGWCDTCPADRIELLLDVVPPENGPTSRYITSINGSTLNVRHESDSGLYAFTVSIGDFEEIRPSVIVRTTDDLSEAQDEAVQNVRVVTAQRANGYVIKMKIPFLLLGFDRVPLNDENGLELGCSVVLYDVDNEFREDETTILATSQVQPLDPSTYGAVSLIPDGVWYGSTTNIYTDAVLGTLRELGF